MKKLIGNTDIEKAVFFLKEIDAWLAFNQRPSKKELKTLRADIQDFVKHFPECWKCGDTGYVGEPMENKTCDHKQELSSNSLAAYTDYCTCDNPILGDSVTKCGTCNKYFKSVRE